MKLTKEQFTISGMHCNGCAERITKMLENIEGVRSADVSFGDEQTAIEFDREQATLLQMREAVEKAGYKAKMN